MSDSEALERAIPGFTPGPLRAAHYAVFDAKGRCVALTNCESVSTEQENAYARFFAAAPALYSIAKRWAALDGGAWHPERYEAARTDLLRDTRAALAQAEGRP